MLLHVVPLLRTHTRLIQDSKNFRMKTRNSHYSSLVMSTFVWHIVVCIGRQKREGYFIAALPPSPVVFIVLNNKFCAFSIRFFLFLGWGERAECSRHVVGSESPPGSL